MKRVATIAAVLVGALLALAAVDLKASNHTQPSTAIGTVSVAASLFSPATRDPESPYINRGSVLDTLCSDVAQNFNAPVVLPTGADVTSMTVLFKTNHPEATIGAELGMTDLALLDSSLSESSGWMTRLGSVGDDHIPVGEVARLSEDLRRAHRVQPGATYYLLVSTYCEGEWAKGASVSVYGALISYTYPAALPLNAK